MNVDECIKKRRSIRKFFDIPVPFEYITEILDAGIHAPSAGNVQAFKFIVVTDDEKKMKISDACMAQSWISSAPVVIVICGEFGKLERMYGSRGKTLYTTQDCACAAENMLLKVHDLGLGGCFVSAFENESLHDILDIPKDVAPEVIIPIGYPDEEVPTPGKFEIRDVTFFDHWDNKDVSRPWPLIKFRKPIEKTATKMGLNIKDKVYNFIDKINKKQKQEINKETIGKQ